ncbi:uncharacterized protein K441DRAFT_724742 [Cenococcum geophilum 1.58]|uniref:uncharacterized protein n=1 Tax=Cenococcum geophilum 1.58 TaxID=794803 RepID=UPI00358E116C|nr:hypothetical protein K441DRAFT_724742 [Cenococcum geophilum 1.58]
MFLSTVSKDGHYENWTVTSDSSVTPLPSEFTELPEDYFVQDVELISPATMTGMASSSKSCTSSTNSSTQPNPPSRSASSSTRSAAYTYTSGRQRPEPPLPPQHPQQALPDSDGLRAAAQRNAPDIAAARARVQDALAVLPPAQSQPARPTPQRLRLPPARLVRPDRASRAPRQRPCVRLRQQHRRRSRASGAAQADCRVPPASRDAGAAGDRGLV